MTIETKILKDLGVNLERLQTMLVVGSIGSGKTTLIANIANEFINMGRTIRFVTHEDNPRRIARYFHHQINAETNSYILKVVSEIDSTDFERLTKGFENGSVLFLDGGVVLSEITLNKLIEVARAKNFILIISKQGNRGFIGGVSHHEVSRYDCVITLTTRTQLSLIEILIGFLNIEVPKHLITIIKNKFGKSGGSIKWKMNAAEFLRSN
jgi:energy-coupling factor transporter ATP-binding protein EcfA2